MANHDSTRENGTYRQRTDERAVPNHRRRGVLQATGALLGLAGLSGVSGAETDSDSINTKTRSTIYTPEEVANARENVEKHDWARQQKENAVQRAENYLEGYGELEGLWNLPPGQEIPRSIWVSFRHEAGSPVSGTDIYDHGYYPWDANPIEEPWKLVDPVSGYKFPTNDFQAYRESGRDEKGEFDPDLADDSLLVNELYPEKGETWGVDDGTGWVDDDGNLYTFVAYYNHWHRWWEIGSMLSTFRDAYLYSGDRKYARAGSVLIDRIADVYPRLDTKAYPPSDGYYHNGFGGEYGKAIGGIWENEVVNPAMTGYDAFFPAQEDDQQLVDFLEGKAQEWDIGEKSSVGHVRKNIEDGLVRQILPAVKNTLIRGNFGKHQSALGYSAVVLDEPDGYTGETLEFLFRAGGVEILEDGEVIVTGGDVLPRIVDEVDRDGHGVESVGYNKIGIRNLKDIADVLDGYDAYQGADLYENVKFERMHSGRVPLILQNRYLPHVGDTGITGNPGIDISLDTVLSGFEQYGDPLYAQAAYLKNGNSTEGLTGDIFDPDPEALGDRIEAVIDAEGPLDLPSTTLAGYGFTALRDASPSEFWLVYERNGTSHNNYDTLNLGVHSHELNLSPDLGYPTHTGRWPSRINWQRQTVSHNTVVVDEERQEETWVGIPEAIDRSDRVQLIDARDPDVYPQTEEYRRTTAMINVDEEHSYAVDFFRIDGGDDHHFSFHGAEGPVATTGLDLVAQESGTYAGPDIPQPDVESEENTEYNEEVGNGFNYLANVERDADPTAPFSVDWDVVDTWGVRDDDPDVHLRLTMTSDVDDVAICDGPTPNKTTRGISNPERLKYLIARRSGSDLTSTFTSVLEPYEGARAVESIADVPVTSEVGSGTAVKVSLRDGRTDYVVKTTDADAEYQVGDAFTFVGAFAVYSTVDGDHEYAYVHDGKLLIAEGDQLIQQSQGRFEGVLEDYSRDLTRENELTVKIESGPRGHHSIEDAVGEWIYVETDNERNGVYQIESVEQQDSNRITLDVGKQTTVRQFEDPKNPGAGYEYIVSEGAAASIPLSTTWER